MIKKKLKNGLIVILDKQPSKSITIELTVKVGSNYEKENELGISHFIEHLLFEGTNKRDTRQIAAAIENLGGEINALTSNERTSYYIKIIKKHADVALDILSDIVKNSLFKNESVEKERQVILNEISSISDNPNFYQWIVFQRNLFKKNPAKNPISGYTKTIASITRKQILDYHNSYYPANNIILSVVGNYEKNILKKINYYFYDIKQKRVKKYINIKDPKSTKIETYKEKKDFEHSYLVLGHKTVPRDHKDSYVLDVIRIILGAGMSSRLFNEIRIKRALAYNLGVQHEANLDYGFFAIFLNAEKKKLEEARNIVTNELEKIRKITSKELMDAKNYIEGQYLIEIEDNQKRAEAISFWQVIKDYRLFESYLKNISKVTMKDVERVAKKYFDGKYTQIIIEN